MTQVYSENQKNSAVALQEGKDRLIGHNFQKKVRLIRTKNKRFLLGNYNNTSTKTRKSQTRYSVIAV